METTETEKSRPDVERLEAAALAERIKAENPDLVAGISDKRLARIVNQTFRALNEELGQRGEGVVSIRKLGRLTIRESERERDGTSVKVKKINLKISSRDS